METLIYVLPLDTALERPNFRSRWRADLEHGCDLDRERALGCDSKSGV